MWIPITCTGASALLAILKLFSIIAWSWWLVLAPFYVMVGVYVVLIAALMYAVVYIKWWFVVR